MAYYDKTENTHTRASGSVPRKALPRVDGLYVSGLRYYSANLSRWISRDAIEEQGGVNLYAFLNNRPINSFDILGLQSEGSECTDSATVLTTDSILETERIKSEYVGVSELIGGPDEKDSGPYTCKCRCEAWKNYKRRIRRTTETQHHTTCGKCSNKITLDWSEIKTRDISQTIKGRMFHAEGPFLLWVKLFPAFRISTLVESECDENCKDLCKQLPVPDEPPSMQQGGR